MLRFLVALLAISAVVVTAQRGTFTQFATCSLSGDPHYKTFDDVWHDFQGQGVWQVLKNTHLNVQMETLPCNPPHKVTCLRRAIVQVRNSLDSNANSLVHWISWPGSNQPAYIDGVAYTVAQLNGKQIATSNNIATVTYSGGQVVISARKGDWQINIGAYYMAVKLPYTEGHFGLTYGLCGFFDGNAGNDFTSENGTKWENSYYNVRTNNAKVNQWGSTFAITTQTALLNNALKWTAQGIELLEDIPEPVVPTPEETADMQKVPFENLDAVNQVTERCKTLAQASDGFDIENCIYDAAVLGDVVLAASNEAAAVASQGEIESSDDSLGAGAIAGIALGCVAAVTMFVAIVLYVRLRKVSAAYERALVVRNNNQDTTAAVAENL